MTIVFLHGFLGSQLDFQPIANQRPNSIDTHYLDLPGHGRSTNLPDQTYTFLGAAHFVLTQIQHLHQPALYGYSMGGRLALYLGLNYPDRFSHLFLESTSPGLATKADRTDRRTQDATLAAELQQDFPAFLRSWYDTELFKTLRDHPRFPALLDRRNNNNPIELAKALQGMGLGSQPPLWEKLNAVPIPIDLIIGTEDWKFLTLNQKMAHTAPHARLNIVPGVGHNIHTENPEMIDRILTARLGLDT
jgi:2-succinyl-6-hydroxy-2,4-cyclohexadiene-1-carboxylate synthase